MSEPDMREYVRKPKTVKAVQWHKIGDHPSVVEFPGSIPPQYVLVDETGEYIDDVEPTDWIAESVFGGLRAVADDLFRARYALAAAERPAAGDAWIPVAERLPEAASERTPFSDNVLVFRLGRSGPWVGYRDHRVRQWYSPGGERLADVTHWMPLPPPPPKREEAADE